jgi:predicted  nucleic acid-binding Zn-ribbon protein
MPHQCTDCGRAFEDGSKEMLSGCPNCGGTTFQFRPEGADFDPDEPPEPPEPAGDGVARTVGNAATAVRDLVVGGSPDPAGDGPPADDPLAMGEEDDAQASARSETIPPEHLSGTKGAGSVPPEWTARSAGGTASPTHSESDELGPSDPGETSERSDPGETGPEPSDDAGGEDTDSEETDERSRPDLSELREELNDQFESIRVIEPGQYELNLMELYDREEYIIALQEDGKYTIQVPDRWEE